MEEEEDCVEEGVCLFGKYWKDIQDAYPEVFKNRTARALADDK